jgi:ubiquinone biosynthesis protein Coq4
MREKFLAIFSRQALRLHAYLRKSTQPWQLDCHTLLAYQPGTLGAALHQFYTQHSFHPLPRMEYHDIDHLILEYPTDVKGEILLQSFIVGNGKKTFFSLLAFAASLCILPEMIVPAKQAYKRGKSFHPIWHIDYRTQLAHPIQQVRARVLVPVQVTPPNISTFTNN